MPNFNPTMPELMCTRHHRRLVQDVDKSYFCPACAKEGIESDSYSRRELYNDA